MSMNGFDPPDFTKPVLARPVIPEIPKIETLPDHTMADTLYDRLIQQIAAFEDDLKEDEEVGACLTNFGREIVISVEDISYHNPGLIIFHGYTGNGDRVTLLQHMTQVNVLLCALKVPEDREPRRIGFQIEEEGDGGVAEEEEEG